MKKLLVIMLLVMYGLSSTGMTMHVHYCCGKVDQVALSSAKKTCSKHAKPMKNCCHDQQVDLKVKADQKAAEVQKMEGTYWVAVLPATFSVRLPRQGKQLVPSVFAPPPLSILPLYIFHCVYRI